MGVKTMVSRQSNMVSSTAHRTMHVEKNQIRHRHCHPAVPHVSSSAPTRKNLSTKSVSTGQYPTQSNEKKATWIYPHYYYYYSSILLSNTITNTASGNGNSQLTYVSANYHPTDAPKTKTHREVAATLNKSSNGSESPSASNDTSTSESASMLLPPPSLIGMYTKEDDIHRVQNWERQRSPLENFYLFGYVVMLLAAFLAINVLCSLLPSLVSNVIHHTMQKVMDGSFTQYILHFFSFQTMQLMIK